MAVIDVGEAAINRADTISARTIVFKNNPANLSGTITSVEIYAASALTACEFASFYVVSGDNLSTRDNVTIGDVSVGYTQHGVSFEIQAGDYIGIYFSGGYLDAETTGGDGVWYSGSGVDLIPCTNQLFSTTTGYILSLYGTGTTEEANAIMMGANF